MFRVKRVNLHLRNDVRLHGWPAGYTNPRSTPYCGARSGSPQSSKLYSSTYLPGWAPCLVTVTLNPTWETFHFLWGHLAGRHPAGEGSSIQTLQGGRTSKLALVFSLTSPTLMERKGLVTLQPLSYHHGRNLLCDQ